MKLMWSLLCTLLICYTESCMVTHPTTTTPTPLTTPQTSTAPTPQTVFMSSSSETSTMMTTPITTPTEPTPEVKRCGEIWIGRDNAITAEYRTAQYDQNREMPPLFIVNCSTASTVTTTANTAMSLMILNDKNEAKLGARKMGIMPSIVATFTCENGVYTLPIDNVKTVVTRFTCGYSDRYSLDMDIEAYLLSTLKK